MRVNHLDKSLTVRLGIDRTHAKRDGYVVPYCLAQGELILIDCLQPGLELCLGPFYIDVQGPHEVALAKVLTAMAAERHMMSLHSALFMKAIPLNKEGSYTITVQQMKGDAPARDIATVKVVVFPEEEAAWSPWMFPEGANALPEDPGYCEMDVANPSAGIALPNCHGAEPIFLDKLPDA